MKRLCLALLFVFVTSAPSYAALSYTEAQIDAMLATVNTGTTPGKAIFAGATYAAIRVLLDLEVGTDFNAYDADLTTYAGITPSANVQSILAGATYAAIRTLIDLESGTDFIPKTGNGTWKVIYTDGSGTQTELALSATSGALLASQGVAAEPAFLTSLSGLTFGGFTASSHVYADGSGNLASAVIAGEEFIPVGWMDIVDGGTDPPTTTYSTATNSREIRIATFDGTTDEALTFLWMVPGNASGTTLKFKWHGIVLEAATAPSAKDISFSLDCVSVADGAQLDFATFDATATAVTETVTEDKDDIIISAYSAAHTPTSMAAGEMMLCELIRDADGADSYDGEDFALIGITIKYAKNESTVTF